VRDLLRIRRPFAFVCAAALVASCASELEPGDHPTFRFVGIVRGDLPLALVPPIADRTGNVYTLWSDPRFSAATAYLSRPQGRSNAVCDVVRGDSYGARGWVGSALDRAWYWGGDSLVEVDSEAGSCEAVLDHDPGTDALLFFKGLLPWIRDTPLAPNSVIALVQSQLDPAPFTTLIDLDAHIFMSVRPFSPPDATFVRVLGVGADRGQRYGVALLALRQGDQDRIEARFYDEYSNETSIAPIEGGSAATVTDFAVAGHLQIGGSGTVAGLIPDPAGKAPPALVTFNRKNGTIRPLDAKMDAVGIHLWHGALHVVGRSGNEPVIATIGNDGNVGAPQTWTWNSRASANVGRMLPILDDRSVPARQTQWVNPLPIERDFLLMSPFSPFPYSDETSLVLIAGPQFETASGGKQTAFAFAPMGITYP
jgi:hypothetical protein